MIPALMLVLLGTFLATVPWGGPLISWLQAHHIGKQIRADGPQTHEAKRGTPTMGGILIVVPVVIIGGLLALGEPRLWAPVFVTALFAVLGAVDDMRGLRDASGVGWLARYKFPWQLMFSFVGAIALYLAGAPQTLSVPVLGWSLYIGVLYVPMAAFVIVSMINAVNFTDGLDGLAGGTTLMAFAGYCQIATAPANANPPLALFCAVFIGAIFAFLWYNAHPARMFMGDIGSLALGAGLASVALLTTHWLLLPIVGAIFVAEALSVILQVGFFKLTGGRRLFRMTPLHHHLELSGWPERHIVMRFWLLGAVLSVVGIALAVMR